VTDRPKHRADVPGCAPWVLVTTRLGRRFVHNKETGESFWRFPDDVLRGVVDMDRVERERRERGEDVKETKEAKNEDEQGEEGGDDESEYTEVEITDDEGAGEEEEDEEGPSKRMKNDQPVEFDEEDLARELEDMGQEFDSDFGDDYQDEDDGLTEEDCKVLFYELLEDFKVSPFTTWDKVVEEGTVVEDSRYTALSSMKARRAAWDEWTRKKIQDLKEARDKEEKKDPRIAYYAFLEEYATPKLYWPEFKRKYRKEAVMKDSKVPDKDREKWYRGYIKRLQLPQSTLKADFTSLLKSLPLAALNRDTPMHRLPAALLADLRFISIPRTLREPLLEAYLTTLAAAPAGGEEDAADAPPDEARTADRERRRRALAERERRVEEEKRRQRRDLAQGRAFLRAEEAEVERAMRVGRGGLRSHIDDDPEPMDEDERE
jgi:hypothetical protein